MIIYEFLYRAFYRYEETSLNKNVFKLFDNDDSGEISFLEFVLFNWNLLTLQPEALGGILYLMGDPTGTEIADVHFSMAGAHFSD